ncbi:MAG TPA: CRISPR-associated endonuclease Cas2 [Saprospiraceae bacterium]|nr:CRISPR-associated endonuclease Cas2 [Saprospiraceae bacterium]
MFDRLNKYKIMWVFVHFDLPTETKSDKKAYTKFRKYLLADGFQMMQFSIYTRHCSSKENSAVHTKRIKANLPEFGNIIIFEITDAQFGRMEFYNGAKPKATPQGPRQLTLF